MSALSAIAAHAVPSSGSAEARAGSSSNLPLRSDKAARSRAARDFGHIVQEEPRAVLYPRSEQDIVALLREANVSGIKVAARGMGHSVFGRSQAGDGVVIAMTELNSIHGIESDRIIVDAGATWREVLAATLPRGLTPPVLTEYLDLSVGGTLAVGGVGATTTIHGFQVDNVLSLDVVTGTGEKVSCSPHSNVELFEMVLGGLGQVAVITRATLKLKPAPEQVTKLVLSYRELEPFLADQQNLALSRKFDALAGSVIPDPEGWTYRLDLIIDDRRDPKPDQTALLSRMSDCLTDEKQESIPYFAYADRFTPMKVRLQAGGAWDRPHPWLATFVGASQVESLLADELKRLGKDGLGKFGQVVLSAFDRGTVRRPLIRLPSDAIVFAFNLIRMPGSPKQVARLIDDNRTVYERVRAAGGTLYPVGALPMSHNDWRQHLGPVWGRLRKLKARFDPGAILAPGYDVVPPVT